MSSLVTKHCYLILTIEIWKVKFVKINLFLKKIRLRALSILMCIYQILFLIRPCGALAVIKENLVFLSSFSFCTLQIRYYLYQNMFFFFVFFLKVYFHMFDCYAFWNVRFLSYVFPRFSQFLFIKRLIGIHNGSIFVAILKISVQYSKHAFVSSNLITGQIIKFLYIVTFIEIMKLLSIAICCCFYSLKLTTVFTSRLLALEI